MGEFPGGSAMGAERRATPPRQHHMLAAGPITSVVTHSRHTMSPPARMTQLYTLHYRRNKIPTAGGCEVPK